MERFLEDYYIFVSLLLAGTDMCIFAAAVRHKDKMGRYIAAVSVFAAAVDLTYLGSILAEDYFIASCFASLYFIGIDWTFIFLMRALAIYAGIVQNNLTKISMKLLVAYAVFDTAMFLINPFREIVISYIPTGFDVVHYIYEMHFIYIMHLVFTYSMLTIIIAGLVYYAAKAPVSYRNRYSLIVISIIVLIAVNALFLYLPGDKNWMIIDYSIMGYSFVLYIIYYSCYKYSRVVVLKNLSMDIFNKIDQGIVFFDYRGDLIMKNQKAEILFEYMNPENIANKDALLAALDLTDIARTESGALQCYIQHGEETCIRRCDYRVLHDEKERITGTLFVFTDMDEETDILTGFQFQKYFERFIEENPDIYRYPTIAAAFDINSLSVINATAGREEGDRMIIRLSELMRKHLPADTYYIRGNEAILIAICPFATQHVISKAVSRIKEEFEGNFQWATGLISPEENNLLAAVDDAVCGMYNRKLLDKNSVSSQAINSLVKTLKEADEDTAAHVSRTQYYGSVLGSRIGLSDVQQSQLSLLCLMHDIGKIGIPLDILNKPGKLSSEEWAVIKGHVRKGYDIARSTEALKDIAGLILHHHERWDGKGYPSGLSMESIPILSRIISVVDTFDALINDRPYRRGTTIEAALAELRRCAGSQFDPYIVSEFIKCISRGEIEVRELPHTSELLEVVTESTEEKETEDINSAVFEVTFSRYVLDSANRILQADDQFFQMTGYGQEDIEKGIYQLDLIPEKDRGDYLVKVNRQLYNNQRAYLEHPVRKKDGTVIYVSCFGRQYYDSAAKAEKSEIFISDAFQTMSIRRYAETQKLKAEQRLAHWERTYRRDSLTGLLSHAPFRNDVEMHLLRKEERIMLFMIDVDNFKEYNDTHGHRAGDEYLVFIANALAASLRSEDMACRMGGDEFSAALFFDKSCSIEQMESRAADIFEKITTIIKGSEYGTGISMGAAISDDLLSSFNDLYSAADRALYISKEAGRNRFTLYRHE